MSGPVMADLVEPEGPGTYAEAGLTPGWLRVLVIDAQTERSIGHEINIRAIDTEAGWMDVIGRDAGEDDEGETVRFEPGRYRLQWVDWDWELSL